MPLSFDQIRDLVRQALEAAHNPGSGSYIYIVELYADSVVYELEGPAGNKGPLYYQRSYALVDDKVSLGEAQPVQKKIEFIPLQAASRILAAAGDPADEGYGYQWRVQVVEYGLGSDGRINWPREPLVAALSLYDGAKVFALADSQHLAQPKPFGKSVRELVGWLKNTADTGTGIEADLFILKSAKWLRDGLVDSHERGMPSLFGLSHDVDAKAVTKMVAGKKVKEPVKITGVQVDVVYDPTNNGRFLRLAAAVAADREEDEMKEKLLAALQKVRPDEFAKIDQEKVTTDELIALLAAAAVNDAGGRGEQLTAAVVEGLKKVIVAGDSDELKQVKLLAAGLMLDRELNGSKLPEVAQAKLRKRFTGQVFEAEILQAAIKEEKEMIDSLLGSGGVTGAGEIRVTRDSAEKLQAACDKLFGVKVADQFSDVPSLRSLRAAYVEITGDTEVRGYLDPGQNQRLQAAYGSATFAYVLGNTLYRRMVADYREIADYGVSRLVGSNIRNAKDFRPMESVRIGYYGDLPTVNTQVEPYPDLGELSDEKVDYALSQKGGVITITRVMIINDDMRAVTKIISRLPRAARRTLAKRCWNKFIANGTYKGDSKAIFHADHGNLGSTAYGIASALEAKTAMAQQTEPGSGERLMLRPVTVAFPTELFGIVKMVNEFQPTSDDPADGNPMFGFFKPEGLVECPFMTDASDWMMFADPNEAEILELAFLNGQQEPEMFVADQPTNGQMFSNDRVQYKIRHEYECEAPDYRGSYKAVVA
ncbi:MAG TPA: hypothetical protein P5244_02810 [Syntrophales bacterium]|nr:hypothetical protein [Syntrophales bacterium]